MLKTHLRPIRNAKFYFFLKTLIIIFFSPFGFAAEAVIQYPQNILLNKQNNVFLVDKTNRRLSVYQPGPLPVKLAEQPADIGKKLGDKQKRNDYRTPEGVYFLEKKLTPPEIPYDLYGQMAFTSNYPNLFDRLAGKTGDGIWLHAVPESIPLTRGSRGCVVVDNKVISSLQNFIELKATPLIIVSQTQWVTSEQIEKRKTRVENAFEQWRKLWESQSLEAYAGYYHPQFQGGGMDKRAWLNHKNKIKSKYSQIKIDLNPQLILSFNNQFVFQVYQNYQSDQYQDKGVKTIQGYLDIDTNGAQGILILSEEWTPVNSNQTATSQEGV